MCINFVHRLTFLWWKSNCGNSELFICNSTVTRWRQRVSFSGSFFRARKFLSQKPLANLLSCLIGPNRNHLRSVISMPRIGRKVFFSWIPWARRGKENILTKKGDAVREGGACYKEERKEWMLWQTNKLCHLILFLVFKWETLVWSNGENGKEAIWQFLWLPTPTIAFVFLFLYFS